MLFYFVQSLPAFHSLTISCTIAKSFGKQHFCNELQIITNTFPTIFMTEYFIFLNTTFLLFFPKLTKPNIIQKEWEKVNELFRVIEF